MPFVEAVSCCYALVHLRYVGVLQLVITGLYSPTSGNESFLKGVGRKAPICCQTLDSGFSVAFILAVKWWTRFSHL